MPTVHRLLHRQLRRLAPCGEDVPGEWRPLLEAVDEAYRQFDEDREMVERSLELSSDELLQANADMHSIFQAFPDVFFRLRADGTIVDRRGKRDPDRDPDVVIGRRLQDIVSAGLRKRFQAALDDLRATGEMVDLEYDSNEGDDRHWEARFVPLPNGEVVVLMRDITQRRSLERQLVQAQKMEAVGRLAGGVAHDFNNILTIIIGYCEVLRDEAVTESAEESVEEIVRASERAAALTGQLLAFSRKQVLQRKVLDLNSIIEGLMPMLERLIGEDVQVRLRLAPDLGNLRGDRSQLEQVLLNLAVNARDAMAAGGSLLIETRNGVAIGRLTREASAIPPGDYVILTVRDTGCGMDESTRNQIFEPFFTTRRSVGGTGLGLATVFGIVKQSGGFIRVDSEVGRGTTFEIAFPRLENEPVEVRSPATTRPLRRRLHGSETILVVEDEQALRDLIRRTLENHGYQVLVASTASEAMHLADDHDGTIDLLLTDVVLPDRPGPVVAERLQARRPHLQVLFVSGYTGNELQQRGAIESGTAFLPKPFDRQVLLDRIDERLRSRRRDGYPVEDATGSGTWPLARERDLRPA